MTKLRLFNEVLTVLETFSSVCEVNEPRVVLRTVYTQIYLCFMNEALVRASDQQLEEKPRLMDMMESILFCTVFLLHSMLTLLFSQTSKRTLNFTPFF